VSQASCYSHHLSQYALRETNWLIRVPECNPYLESLLNYIMRHHHETPTNMGHEITSWPMRHHHEISLRVPWNYTLTNEAPRNYHGITCWQHQHHIPSINITLLLIPIPCHFYNQPSNTHYTARSCQTHHSQPISHFTHKYSLISCFNIAIQLNNTLCKRFWHFRNKTAACVKLQKFCIYIQIKYD